MKAITLTQPWATLVAHGCKRVETRSWPTNYRGPLAIHAAKGFPREARDLCLQEPFASALRSTGIGGLGLASPAKVLPLGAFVATVDLLDCMPTTEEVAALLEFVEKGDLDAAEYGDEMAFGNYAPGRYAWVLAHVRLIPEPIPARGALGLWVPNASDLAAIQAVTA